MVLDQNNNKRKDKNEIRIKAIPKLMDHTLSKLAKMACNHLKKSVTSLVKSGPRYEAAIYPPDFVELDLVGSEKPSFEVGATQGSTQGPQPSNIGQISL